MKKHSTSNLMYIGGGCLLLIGALLFVSLLVTLAVVALTVLLSVIVHELLGRKIDDELPGSADVPSASTAARESLLGGRLQFDGQAEQPARNFRARRSLRTVNHWFQAAGDLVDHSRVQLPPLPSVPEQHQATVQEYLQAGLALGRALNDAVPAHGLAVHPGTVVRFERIESQFASHYRTLDPVQFRQLAAGTVDTKAIEAIIEPLAEGETPYQYAAGLRQQYVRRKAS